MFPKVGSSILPLCNVAVTTNVLNGWTNADRSHIYQCALVKMRVVLGESIDCNNSQWSDKTRDELCSTRRGRTPSRERRPQGATKILQKVYTVLQQPCWSWHAVDAELPLTSVSFFPAILRKVVVVQGPKLPWYFAFIKTSNSHQCWDWHKPTQEESFV